MVNKAEEEPVNATSKIAVVVLVLLFLVGAALGGTLIPGVRDGLNNMFGWDQTGNDSLITNETFNNIIDLHQQNNENIRIGWI